MTVVFGQCCWQGRNCKRGTLIFCLRLWAALRKPKSQKRLSETCTVSCKPQLLHHGCERASAGGTGFPQRLFSSSTECHGQMDVRAFPIGNFIFHRSHTIKGLSGQVACSDHNSKRQSFEEVPQTFKYITGRANETEDVEGPQDQSSCKMLGKAVISRNICFHNIARGYLASQQRQNFMRSSPSRTLNV